MVRSPDSGTTRWSRIGFDVRNSVFAFAYLAIIGWFSSKPDLRTGGDNPLVHLLYNIYHIPLYAGLGFFILQAVSRGQGFTAHRWRRAVLTFVMGGVVSVLDEWNQARVPGREASLGDFLLDLVGIVGLLLVCAIGTRIVDMAGRTSNG